MEIPKKKNLVTKIDLRIESNRYKRRLPATYGDLTRKQALALAHAYQVHQLRISLRHDQESGRVEGLSLQERFILLQAVLDIPEEDFYKIGEVAIQSLLDGSFLRLAHQQVLGSYPVLHHVSVGWIRYHLPRQVMDDSYVIQFAWAERYYRAIQSEQDVNQNLIGLVSVLCSSPRRRLALKICSIMPWLSNHLIDWSKITADKVSSQEAFAVLIYYYMTRQALVESYSPIFDKSSGRGGGPDLTSKYEWWALIHDLADKGVFGNFYQTCYANLHDVLHHVSYNSDKYREQELKRTVNG